MKFLFFMLLSINLYAHQTSLALLNMQVLDENSMLGSYKLAVKDAQLLVNLDSNFDQEVTWKEILGHEKTLKSKIQTHFMVKSNFNPCILDFNQPMLLDYLDSNKYVHFNFKVSCKEKIEALDLRYSLLFDKDSMHKVYVNIKTSSNTHNTLFSEDKLEAFIDFQEPVLWNTFYEFIKQGVIHIFIGIDHILFLVALLLPSVLFIGYKQWQPHSSVKSILVNVLKIVTAFTIAHSITLTLTILGFISLPSWIVESFIAFSVILAGINNLMRIVEKHLWVLVFIFGLIHGMGFASVLMDLELEENSLVTVLLGFNLGVELGQIVIVSLLLPFIYILRNQKWYVPVILYFGSFLLVIIGTIWLIERIV